MDINEFNAKVVRSEGSATITFDVRAFGDRQAEAIESYLHGRLMNLQMGIGGFGARTVILLCTQGTQLSSTGSGWLAELNARGVSTDVRMV